MWNRKYVTYFGLSQSPYLIDIVRDMNNVILPIGIWGVDVVNLQESYIWDLLLGYGNNSFRKFGGKIKLILD